MSFLKNKRVVITGGKGFLGRYVSKEISKESMHCIPLGSKDYDLRKEEEVQNLFRVCKPNIYECFYQNETYDGTLCTYVGRRRNDQR